MSTEIQSSHRNNYCILITTMTHCTQTKVDFKNALGLSPLFEILTIETMVIANNKTTGKEM